MRDRAFRVAVPGFRFAPSGLRVALRWSRSNAIEARTHSAQDAKEEEPQAFREDEFMLSRRNFLTSTIAAGAALATQGPHKAAAQVDRRMIVDAQIHLWKAESEDWKWVPGLQPQ